MSVITDNKYSVYKHLHAFVDEMKNSKKRSKGFRSVQIRRHWLSYEVRHHDRMNDESVAAYLTEGNVKRKRDHGIYQASDRPNRKESIDQISNNIFYERL